MLTVRCHVRTTWSENARRHTRQGTGRVADTQGPACFKKGDINGQLMPVDLAHMRIGVLEQDALASIVHALARSKVRGFRRGREISEVCLHKPEREKCDVHIVLTLSKNKVFESA